MIINKKIEQYNKNLLNRFKDKKTWFFTDDFMDSDFIKLETECYSEYYSDGKFSENAFMFAFEGLSLYTIDRAIYFLISKNNKEEFLKLFSLYSYYSYITIHESAKSCKCLKGIPYIFMHRTTHLFSSNIIVKQWDKVELLGKDLINSLNAENCIIKRGDRNALQAWFIIELFSKSFDYEINKRRALYPKDFSPFDEILENWDTKDLLEVDKYIYILCDAHLEIQAQDEEEILSKLEIPPFLLFPFEVIAWLRLREYKGFENPKDFSHALMNEAIAKTLLEINAPLEEPTEVPFLNEFLGYVYNHCPDMEKDKKFIVKKEIKDDSNNKIGTINRNAHAPKTGNYQALLPNNHPKIEKIKINPHAYSYYEKDDKFIYDGLEEAKLIQVLIMK